MPTTSQHSLRPRRLSLAEGTALYVGAVLGTGVLALPGLAARTAGPASLLSWLALAVFSVPVAATFAALAARYPDAGGVATFARLAFGRRTAAVTGWWFYLGLPVGVPAAALFGGAYVAAAVGGGRDVTFLVAAALIAVTLAANLVGLGLSARLQLALSGLLVVLLLAAIVAALPQGSATNLHPLAPHGWLAVGTAGTLLLWSFTGWEAVTQLSAEFARPGRDLRRATTIAVLVVAVLYLAVAAATVLVLGPAAGRSGAPLALLLGRAFGPAATVLTAGAAVLLTLGTMNSYLASLGKLGSALGRDGMLPAWLAVGSAPGAVPRRALLVTAAEALTVLGVAGVSGSSTGPLVLATSAGFVAVYLVVGASAIRLLPGRTERTAAVAALLLAVALAAFSGWYLLWPLLLGAAALAYVSQRDRRPSYVPVEEHAELSGQRG